MEEKIEIPPGLIRTWKAGLGLFLSGLLWAIAGFYTGHNSARVVEKEVRVEVPTPACRDELIQIADDEKKRISCPHPDQHGEFRTIFVNSWGSGNVPYLICTCPHPQLDLDGGR